MKQLELFSLTLDDELSRRLPLDIRDAINEEIIKDLISMMTAPQASVPGQLTLDLI